MDERGDGDKHGIESCTQEAGGIKVKALFPYMCQLTSEVEDGRRKGQHSIHHVCNTAGSDGGGGE